MTESTEKPDSSFVPVRDGRFGLKRVLAVVIVSAIAIVSALVIVNRWIAPEVEASETKPVVVSQGEDSKNDNSAQNGLATSTDSSLPEGAISATINQAIIDQADHPFDPLLSVARSCLEQIDRDIFDYSATLVSQVRVGGELMDEKYLTCKIRHARDSNDDFVPFSVYTLFLKPKSNVGQEAIWVEGWNEGNLVAHTTGLMNVKRFYLDPDGRLAMTGNRYPIREIGFRNLLAKMVRIGEEDRKHGECVVTIQRHVMVNDRDCTVLKVVHPVKRDHFEFHVAKIYLDDERNIPIAYEGYSWPEKEGGEVPLVEKYFYTDIKLNVGLKDIDFDPANQSYDYPSW